MQRRASSTVPRGPATGANSSSSRRVTASPRAASATCSTASSAPWAVPCGPALLVDIEGLAGGRAVGGEADLLDLRLGFAQLGIAVALQRGAAVVVADGAVQRELGSASCRERVLQDE